MYSPRDEVLTRTRPSIALCQNSQASVWRSTIDEKAPHDARAEPQCCPQAGVRGHGRASQAPTILNSARIPL